MTGTVPRDLTQSGFSIIEVLFVLGLIAVVSTMAALQVGVSRPGIQGDGAMRIVLGQLNQARETAITQRRFVRIVFTTPNLVQAVREDTSLTTTTLSSVLLESGVEFALVSGVPDTPDQFGKDEAIAFGTVTNVKFSPEGMLVNQDGASTNGTIFLALPNQKLSARAVTVLGSTGRVRGYKWDGSKWTQG